MENNNHESDFSNHPHTPEHARIPVAPLIIETPKAQEPVVVPAPLMPSPDRVRRFAQVGGGWLMVVMAALSLVMPGSAQGLPVLSLEWSYGLFAGVLPMNIINKIVLVFFGVMGIMCAKDTLKSSAWAFWVFVVMGFGAILGVIPQTQTFFGHWPLWGGEVILHLTFAVLGIYFSYWKPKTKVRQ